MGGAGAWPGRSAANSLKAHNSAAQQMATAGACQPQRRRMRSTSRRRKIKAEIETKQAHRKDAWALQQQLLEPGASATLMEAARKLLQPADYEAIVLERALEGICGYPPCKEAATTVAPGKQWVINIREHELVPAKELTQFCSRECRNQNWKWVQSLEPDPAYIRPASAVAASRAAVAEARCMSGAKAQDVQKESQPQHKEQPVDSQASVKEQPGDSQASTKEVKATDGALPNVRQKAVVRFSREKHVYTADCADYDGGGALPDAGAEASCAAAGAGVNSGSNAGGVCGQRPKAVVRFSRENHSYKVNYADYDGGGALPGMGPEANGSASSGQNAAAAKAPSAQKAGIAAVRSLVTTQVVERCQPAEDVASTIAAAAASGRPAGRECIDAATEEHPRQQGTACSSEEKTTQHLQGPGSDSVGSLHADGEEDLSDDDADANLFETNSACPATRWDGSPFVRAWGVLTSWLTGPAMEALYHGIRYPTLHEESQPVFSGRRLLLRELMSSRVPGDASFLSLRFDEVVSALGVHQTLPTVTEAVLWDLLAALLLRAVLRCDVHRGVREPNPYCQKVLDYRVEQAVRELGLSVVELETLDAILPETICSQLD